VTTYVVTVIEALLAEYERHALPGERFSQTVDRVGSQPFFHVIAAASATTGTEHSIPA
jgi:dissimilatory sulfite reductase (desulfoviridin) alpha/beta subunit